MPWGVAVAAVAAGSKAYSSHREEQAANEAGHTQAKGVAAAQEASAEASKNALDTVNTGFSQARDQINSGANLARENLLSGRNDSLYALNSGYDAGSNDLTTNYNNADSSLSGGYNQAQNTLRPEADQGNSASHLQAALSGSLGADAQAEAFKNYSMSPGQKYLQDQQEQSILRNESALGGGVSSNGRVLSALQEQAAGNAAQNYNTNFGQLGTIAARGTAANDSIAQLQAGLGQSRSALQAQLGNLLSGLSVNRGTGTANINTGYAGDAANLNQSTGMQLANSLSGQAGTVSADQINEGLTQAQLAQNKGVALSGGAMFRSQNAAPISQGIDAGLKAYGSYSSGGFGGGK